METIGERLRRRERRQVCPDNPGTILTKDEMEKMGKYVGMEVVLKVGSYEWEDEDWNSPITEERSILLEGILGYQRKEDNVVTHLVGTTGEDHVIYALTAWHDFVDEISDKAGDEIFENSHFWFYYKTKNGNPIPGLYDKGMDFHVNNVKMAHASRSGEKNQFLAAEYLASLKQKDLAGNEIIRLK